MKTLMITAAAIAMLAGTASADPVKLSDKQLQGQAGGFIYSPIAVIGLNLATPTSVNTVVGTGVSTATGVLADGVLASTGNLLGASNITGIGTPAP
jgi:hypothetical protein